MGEDAKKLFLLLISIVIAITTIGFISYGLRMRESIGRTYNTKSLIERNLKGASEIKFLDKQDGITGEEVAVIVNNYTANIQDDIDVIVQLYSGVNLMGMTNYFYSENIKNNWITAAGGTLYRSQYYTQADLERLVSAFARGSNQYRSRILYSGYDESEVIKGYSTSDSKIWGYSDENIEAIIFYRQ